MLPPKARLLQDSVRRFLRRQAWEPLARLVAKTREEELAAVLSTMAEDDQIAVFRLVHGNERKANVIVQMQAPFGKRVLDPLPPPQAAAILREMAPDDAADILADLEPEHARKILAILDGSEQVETLMRFGEDTAGGIMLPDFLALRADDTAEEAIQRLRDSGDVEMVYYIYVVDEHGHLVGVISLRRLVAAPPHMRVREIMEPDVISVTTDTDQEEVARLVARYGFLAVPVVDEGNRLVGIVTVDDVIDVLREEATEDILKMAGAGTDLSEVQSVPKNVRIRFPWLLASAGGGLVGAAVMGGFDETLAAHHYLAFFLPIILGMSGNVGTQSATVTVRALAMGHIGTERNWDVVRKEVSIGLLMGTMYGMVVGGVAAIFGDTPAYGLAVGLAMGVGMTVASCIGTTIPLVLSRLGIDPAVATGPFVTTSVDILGILTYFTIASTLVSWIVGH